MKERGYTELLRKLGLSFRDLPPGTFALRLNVLAGRDRTVNVPVDVVIQPPGHHSGGLPILIEAKSAGDFTNTNKRRKEEATKVNQLRTRYGEDLQFVLFLCGYLSIPLMFDITTSIWGQSRIFRRKSKRQLGSI